jgi:hypothetical protein
MFLAHQFVHPPHSDCIEKVEIMKSSGVKKSKNDASDCWLDPLALARAGGVKTAA